MDAATAATLYEACQLLAMADRMEERVNADRLTIPGSNLQMVPHGLLTEIRVVPGQNGASRAGAARATMRHHGRTPGVRTAQ